MVETHGLTHVHLYVQDLERALAFYREAFGLVEMFRDGPLMVFLRTPGAADTITLNERRIRVARGGIEHIGFRLKDKSQLDPACEQVVAAGAAESLNAASGPTVNATPTWRTRTGT